MLSTQATTTPPTLSIAIFDQFLQSIYNKKIEKAIQLWQESPALQQWCKSKPIMGTNGEWQITTFENLFILFKTILLNAPAYKEIFIAMWESNLRLQKWYMGWQYVEAETQNSRHINEKDLVDGFIAALTYKHINM